MSEFEKIGRVTWETNQGKTEGKVVTEQSAPTNRHQRINGDFNCPETFRPTVR
jgi:hypothetical protein